MWQIFAGKALTSTRAFFASKTGAVVVLPIHTDFANWLSERPRGIGKAPVFPELAGERIAGGRGLSVQFRDIVDDLKAWPDLFGDAEPQEPALPRCSDEELECRDDAPLDFLAGFASSFARSPVSLRD